MVRQRCIVKQTVILHSLKLPCKAGLIATFVTVRIDLQAELCFGHPLTKLWKVMFSVVFGLSVILFTGEIPAQGPGPFVQGPRPPQKHVQTLYLDLTAQLTELKRGLSTSGRLTSDWKAFFCQLFTLNRVIAWCPYLFIDRTRLNSEIWPSKIKRMCDDMKVAQTVPDNINVESLISDQYSRYIRTIAVGVSCWRTAH